MVVCGDVWWFAVVCDGLWWFAMFAVVCLLVIPLDTDPSSFNIEAAWAGMMDPSFAQTSIDCADMNLL